MEVLPPRDADDVQPTPREQGQVETISDWTMKTLRNYTRRDFLKAGAGAVISILPAGGGLSALASGLEEPKSVVSIVKINENKIEAAVEEAIDLLGGIEPLTRGKNRILIKPNLVISNRGCTTKWEVVAALARLMQAAGKEVAIGEASAGQASVGPSTRCEDILRTMQEQVFASLGYSTVAKSLGIPLVNLHLGPFVTVPVPDGLFWQELVLNQVLVETDLLCSVAMMKTHVYATVTLALKNAIGLYPGAIYGSYRWWVHDNAYLKRSPGIAYEILDMVRVNKFGLAVVDGSTAMQGDGPTSGSLVKMNLIIAGTSPLAADMVAASVMGIQPAEVPTLVWAGKLGMKPSSLEEIEVRGTPIADVKRRFVRASLTTPGGGGTDTWPAPVPRIESTSAGKAVVSWNEAIPKALLEYNGAGKAKVTWTNALQGSRAILEQNSLLQRSGWQRVTPVTPGRHEIEVSEAARFFRLRKP